MKSEILVWSKFI